MRAPAQARWTAPPDSSRSVQSPWVWRAFAVMALVGIGLSMSLFETGQATFGAAWAVIALGWLVTAMWLWRRHHLAGSAPSAGSAGSDTEAHR